MESRIAKMFRLLRKQGFIAKRNFWCCRSCAWYDLETKPETKKAEDVVFIHSQAEQSWRETGSTHLAWSGNGQAIVDAAKSVGLVVVWDGSEYTTVQITNPEFSA